MIELNARDPMRTGLPPSSGARAMSALLGAAAAVIIGLSSVAAAATPAPVRVQSGWIRGAEEHGVTVYRGVPFAAPPVGPLRWHPPQPPAAWSGVRYADRFAPACMQPPPWWNRAARVSEDCLYLNIWTPARSPRAALPVMVWIYGGGFSTGATSLPVFDGQKLARHGVIVVSIAYRGGPMGFLALPALSAQSPYKVSGNYGLLDQIAALRWVQRNIAGFGGDPHRVTIFGESAGAISVSILTASPLARGLFEGAISESGGSFGPTRTPPAPGENLQTLRNAEQQGLAFEKQLGASSLQQMRALPAATIQRAASGQVMFWPVLDGHIIVGDQFTLYQQGHYNDTPILIGTNSDEGALFGTPPSRHAYVLGVRARFGPFADRILHRYPGTPAAWRQSSMDLMRDAGFAWQTWAWARLQSRAGGSKVYLYYFDHVPPRPAGSPWRNAIGAVHSEEIAYVFQHLDQSPSLHWSADDRLLSTDMAAYWTNFAKSGDPNGPGLPYWPAFTESSPSVMHFTDAPHVGPVPNLKNLEVLDSYFAWRRTRQGAAWADHGAHGRAQSRPRESTPTPHHRG